MNAVAEDVNKTDELKDLRDAFLFGINNNKTEDEIKMAMIKAGATFKNVTRLFNQFSIDAGLTMKKEEKDSVVAEVCTTLGDALATEEGFQTAVDEVVNKVTGADEGTASRLIRAWARKNEVEVFKKTGGGGTRQSGFRFKFYEALKGNPTMDEKEAEDLINEHGSENDKRHMSHYQGIRELANNIAAS